MTLSLTATGTARVQVRAPAADDHDTTVSQPGKDQSLGKRSGNTGGSTFSADHVDASRGFELEQFVGDLGIDVEIIELDPSDLTQSSTSSSRRGSLPLKPISIEPKSEPPRAVELDPIQAVVGGRLDHLEFFAHVAVAAQHLAGLAPTVSSNGVTVI